MIKRDGWMDDILPTRLNSLRENAAPGHFIQYCFNSHLVSKSVSCMDSSKSLYLRISRISNVVEFSFI